MDGNLWIPLKRSHEIVHDRLPVETISSMEIEELYNRAMRDRIQSKHFSLSFVPHCTIGILYSSRKVYHSTDSVPKL